MVNERARFPSAVHIIMLRAELILLLRRKNTGYMDGHFGLPAGHLEGNETVKQAAMREVREEVGVELNPAELLISHVMHRMSDQERIDWFLTARGWSGAVANAEPAYCEEIKWFSLRELPPDIIPYVSAGIHHTLSGVTFSEFGFST